MLLVEEIKHILLVFNKKKDRYSLGCMHGNHTHTYTYTHIHTHIYTLFIAVVKKAESISKGA